MKRTNRRPTMQTASTPWNHPPTSASFLIFSSRPWLPFSSIPSKQYLKFTGKSFLLSWWYFRTLSQPTIGPLSSVDPRPTSLPSGCSVRLKGSPSTVSHLSSRLAWRIQNVNANNSSEKKTYGHNIVVTVDENCLLIGVIPATPAFDYWWQVFLLVIRRLLDELGFEIRENVEFAL